MNYLLRVRGWGRVRVECTYPPDGSKDARVELTDSDGAVLPLTPDDAEALADKLEKATGVDMVPVATLAPIRPALVARAVSVLRRAAYLARGETAPPDGVHPFRVA